MNRLWLTYSWSDNRSGDVDYLTQQMTSAGLNINLDRWTLRAGEHLWSQIATQIQDKNLCDAWAIYATQNSLSSPACQEEFAYAIDRALHSRGENFPIIGIFSSHVDNDLVPPALRVRLHVSTTDPSWIERVRNAVLKDDLRVSRQKCLPYELKIHSHPKEGQRLVVEVRPRAGSWSPFIAGIPLADSVSLDILRAPKEQLTNGVCILHNKCEGTSLDGRWQLITASDEATPSQSYFLLLSNYPTLLVFGSSSGPQFKVSYNLGQFVETEQ